MECSSMINAGRLGVADRWKLFFLRRHQIRYSASSSSPQLGKAAWKAHQQEQQGRARQGCGRGSCAAAARKEDAAVSVPQKASSSSREGQQHRRSPAGSTGSSGQAPKQNGSGASPGRHSGTDEAGIEQDGEDVSKWTAYAAPAALLLGVVALLGGGIAFKSQLRGFIDYFVEVVDTWGPLRYAAYGGLYTVLEVLALPAVPLTMTAGLLFGVPAGTAVVSVSSTAAATISFLIARYAARDRIQALAAQNAKFKAVDRAIGRNSLKVVVLLRLSPLLPLALSNYLYGLTSVDLASYVFGSWAGMLPGTIAYVAAGSYGRALLDGEGEGLAVEPWQVALGIGFTLAALLYIGRVAKTALDEEEARQEDA